MTKPMNKVGRVIQCPKPVITPDTVVVPLYSPPTDDDLIEDVCHIHGKQKFFRFNVSGVAVCSACAKAKKG